ncbi:hypothetical protein [uncultured Bacteroides sp.]|jgi:hypothetical protein|uniref:hypothetical protein n=1 Tax=uncultured Bacteroides sp. TaxID=162156 RepID=UPI00258E7B8C|nr:hypothetical protein [uncultured Bacteroides sp.]
MNRICIFVSFLSAIFLLEGCTSRKEPSTGLPSLKELRADSISIPPVLLSVTRLFVVNNMLVAYEQRKDTMFSFWKLPECNYLFSAGCRGDGPNDFLMLDRTFQATPHGFKTFELSSSRIKEVAIDSMGLFKVLSNKQLEVEQGGLNRFLFLEDDSYCFISDKEEYEYTLLDKHKGVCDFSSYPEGLLRKEQDELNRFVYNKLTVASPKGDKFAAFYAYIKLCRIYNSKGELLEEQMLRQPDENISEEKHIYYSSYPYADENYIYILTDEEEGKILEIWNWEGALVSRYLLDKPVDCLAASSANGKVYAVCQEREDVIYTYNIP